MQWILHDIPIGRNIRNIRVRKNMTQLELVTKMQLMGSSMSRSTLANIETGRRNVKASDLNKKSKKIFTQTLSCPPSGISCAGCWRLPRAGRIFLPESR